MIPRSRSRWASRFASSSSRSRWALVSASALAWAWELSMAAFWARTDIKYATAPAARASARKIQLIKFMGDSKE